MKTKRILTVGLITTVFTSLSAEAAHSSERQTVILTSRDESTLYRVESESGPGCRTPCTLRLVPGLFAMRVATPTDQTFTAQIMIPAGTPSRVWLQHYTQGRHFVALGLILGGLVSAALSLTLAVGVKTDDPQAATARDTFAGLFGAFGAGSLIASGALLAAVRYDGASLRPLGVPGTRPAQLRLVAGPGAVSGSVALTF